MLYTILILAISIWTTSTLFMLFFYLNVQFQNAKEGKLLIMPFGYFVLMHFCPIVHTVKCFKILKTYSMLKAAAQQKVD